MIQASVLVLALALQEPPPAPPLPGGAAEKPVDPAILALVPGAIPAEATSEAREDWKRIGAATLAPGAERAPITAFDLTLDLVYKRSASGRNEARTVYRYLAPGFVRIDLEKKSSTMRGPDGDWLVDHARNGQTVDLRVGREHTEDRRQLDETLSVARHFVALSDPARLRMASLEKLAGPPAGLPKALEERAKQLGWLRLRSPDFRLVGAGATAPMSRASVGFAKDTGRVEIALVEEDRPSPAMLPSAKTVVLSGSLEAQGYLVPKAIKVYSIEEGKPGFTVEPGMDLYVVRANLKPALGPEQFKPK